MKLQFYFFQLLRKLILDMNGICHENVLKQTSSLWSPGLIIQLGLVTFSLGLLFFSRGEPLFDNLAVIFVSIVLEAFPFMLVGAVISGAIEVFLSKDRIISLLPNKRYSAVFVAAGLGVVFPVCECAIVPVVRRLVRKGIPFSAAIAFLLGGPIVNPVVFASTAVAYGFSWDVPIMRVLFGYIIAVSIGIFMGFLFNRRTAFLPIHTAKHLPMYVPGGGSKKDGQINFGKKIQHALAHAADDFIDVAGYLVLGAFIAALIQSSIDRSAFLVLGESSSLAVGAMMFLAVILNLCSEADAFVAASFRLSVPMSAQMAFMVLGPMLDLKLIFMYFNLFRKRTILVLTIVTSVVVYVAMLSQVIFVSILATLMPFLR